MAATTPSETPIDDDDDSGPPTTTTDRFVDTYRWSADCLREFVLFCFVDHQGNVRTATHKALAAKWGGSLSSGWQYHTVKSGGSKEVNVGIWKSGRIYLTYSTETFTTTNAFGTTYFKCSSDGAETWEAEQTTTGYIDVGSEPASNKQPYHAKYNNDTNKYEYVKSQNVVKGTEYFQRGIAGNRLYAINDRIFPVYVGSNTVYRQYLPGNSDEQGTSWDYINKGLSSNHNSVSDYPCPYKTYGPDYGSSQAIYFYPDAQVGLLEQTNAEAGILAFGIGTDALLASPPVRLSNGTYARLLWTHKARKVRVTSNPFHTLENDYATPTMPFSVPFDVEIPTSSIDAEKITFYSNHEYSTRQIIEGVPADSRLPTAVDFTIDGGIQWSDLRLTGTLAPYLIFRYKNAKQLTLRLGNGTGAAGKTLPVDGRGRYEWFAGNLSAADYALFESQSSASLPLILSGGEGEVEMVGVSLRVGGIYGLPKETWAVKHRTLGHSTYAFHSGFQYASIGNRQFPVRTDSGTYESALRTWMNANKGTIALLETEIDKDPAVTSAWPLLINVSRHFAVFEYHHTQADFFLLTSNDGKLWEYAADGEPLSHSKLNNLRTWNRTSGNTALCPTLVAAGDILTMLWLENGAVTALGSNDSGQTWSD